MGRISQAIGYAFLCLMLAAPIEAAPLKVIPSGAVRLEQFYAIPVNRVTRAVLANRRWLREKVTCCSWGPHGLAARPDTSPGQWYIFPVCRQQVVLTPILVEPNQTQVFVSCP
jgi:hypothetical protein